MNKFTLASLSLTIGIVVGIFGAEWDMNTYCSSTGTYKSMFFSDVRCKSITTHTSLESAKAQVRVYQAKVRG